MADKMWGAEPFWGLGYEWDPNWVLTERQQELRATLIELCEQEIRANAKRSDDELLYPRRNLELLGEHGFLALTVPEEYGGLGENHVAYSMVCETIARYGCASTAMCYVMHIGAVTPSCCADRRPDRQVHPAAELRQARHAVVLRPRDRIALLVPGLAPAPSARTAATASGRRPRGPPPPGSPTSTSCRRRARTSRATTTCRCS